MDEAGLVSPEMVRTLKTAQATGSVTIVMTDALHDWRRATSEDKKSLVASNRSSESSGAEGGGRVRRDDRAFVGDAPLTRRDDRSLTTGVGDVVRNGQRRVVEQITPDGTKRPPTVRDTFHCDAECMITV
ncbi:hypothetical protein JIM95_008345 [Corynebacterium sp. CCM 8835]|uniref:Uncharacterized protein n=1 Tax=Corynebacterium antarcticum TaxID=2800405 RepID=A0A9Q4GL23_9CORY|nr:hypothetical protein [Corynebacterium antarcticum]MCK7642906.1 hypothetical protein [Corynebacterium antarcticum]MCK7661409.1 hypothetical protein [Corynebacterium antarcticum]MCL0246146.1 hypothetical protein [Corynebacterium antarcticum]MCX7492395.1 hypothetical protein [Corynebacterium antarcticum]MCX7538492.1 hypothetical protein [Corynebacterium antarcticum]